MKIITTIHGLKKEISVKRKLGSKIGFVPTMGALHEGHLSLIRQAKREAGFVVISIFVNPTQFGPTEDFEKYPRDIAADSRLAKKAGADIIFAPKTEDIYGSVFRTFVDMKGLPGKLCGKSRPGHFRGVMTVVVKLFNIVEPDIAFFGQKDYQQAVIIRKMVEDLNMDLEIKLVPTVREPGGLAMSSRNHYLSSIEHKNARIIFQSLSEAEKLILSGENRCHKVVTLVRRIINAVPGTRIDYIEIVDSVTLETVKKIAGRVVILVAVFFGKTRLIDNIVVCK